MLQMMNLKMIEHTFPPLNIWWVRTKISTKFQEECSFTHPTNCCIITVGLRRKNRNIENFTIQNKHLGILLKFLLQLQIRHLFDK